MWFQTFQVTLLIYISQFPEPFHYLISQNCVSPTCHMYLVIAGLSVLVPDIAAPETHW